MLNRPKFNFEMEITGDIAVFHLRGRPSLGETADLRKTFWDCISQGPVKKLILELSGVSPLDPSAISLFIATKNVVSKHHGQLVLTGISEESHALLQQTHLLNYFEICDNLEEARAFNAQQPE